MTRRPRRPPPDTGGDRWLGTYGDMITLLMAFFVMLFAISSVEAEKFEAFLAGLDKFGNPAASDVEVGVGAPDGVPVLPAPPPADSVVESERLEDLGQALLDAVAAAGFEGTIEIHHDDRGLGVSIGTDHVLFGVGSADMTQLGEQILAAMAPVLAGVSNHLLIEGHADTTPLNVDGYTNWNLSTDRAVAVVDVFLTRHGFSPQRFTASGFGEFRPRALGDDAQAKARNRRVELVVVDAGAAPGALPAAEPR